MTGRSAPAGATGAAVAGLGRDSGRTILGTAATTVANFALVAVLARTLGDGAVGSYSVAFALRAVLVLVAGMGMRVAMPWFVASLSARGDHAGLRGAVRVGTWLPTGASVLVAVALAAWARPLAEGAFGNPDLTFPLRMVALSLPFSVLMDTCLAATRGFRSMRAYAGIGLVLEPVLRLALTALALVLGAGLDGAAAALAAAGCVSGVAAAAALRRHLRPLGPGSVVQLGGVMSFASVSWVASLATQGLLWADILILGVLVSDAQVGVYQVATRALLAATLMVTPLTTAMAPRVAHAFETGDGRALAAGYNSVVLWCWRLTLPLLAGVAAVPTAALALFGDDFAGGVGVIRILAVGAVVDTLAAPSAVLLNQVGRNRFNMAVNVAALAANVALNLLLVPALGIDGAALAWAVVMVVPGLVRVVAVRHLRPRSWSQLRPHAVALGAAAAAGASAYAVARPLAGTWSLQLPVAAAVVVALYPAAVVAAGLTAGERRRLRTAVRLARGRVATELPVLRRVRNRWRVRRLRPGPGRIAIEDLISPWRYDVLARVDVFRLIRDHPVPVEEDLPRFLARVRSSRYRTWFDHVLVEVLGLQGAAPAVRERVFEQVVVRAVQLYRSVEARGFDRRQPVTVAPVPAGTEVGGRSLAEDRWVPLDGCHRLALMYLNGKRHLESTEYAVDPLDVRRYHTERMARAERLARADLVGFFARGLAVDGARPRSWEELVQALRNPENRAPLERWPEAAWLAAGSAPDWFEAHQLDQPRPVAR